MPLPRVRLRTLMIAVALLAVALTGVVTASRLRSLREHYKKRALGYQIDESLAASSADSNHGLVSTLEDFLLTMEASSEEQAEWRASIVKYRADAAQSDVEARYYAAMKLKYRRAARHPWLPVPPDPPMPE